MTDTPKLPPTLENLRDLRDEILAIAEKYGAYNVRVFGSVARAEANPKSDIDFLVSFREGASLFDLSGLRLDLMDLLDCSVDVISEHDGLNERFRKRVLQDIQVL